MKASIDQQLKQRPVRHDTLLRRGWKGVMVAVASTALAACGGGHEASATGPSNSAPTSVSSSEHNAPSHAVTPKTEKPSAPSTTQEAVSNNSEVTPSDFNRFAIGTATQILDMARPELDAPKAINDLGDGVYGSEVSLDGHAFLQVVVNPTIDNVLVQFSNQDPNNVSPDYSTLQMNFGMGESANGILRHAKVLNTATFLEILNSKGATAKSLYVGAEANTPTNIYKVTNGGKSARQGKTLSDSKAAWSATPPTIGTIERVTQQTIETIVGDK